jgi:hypothetical protein
MRTTTRPRLAPWGVALLLATTTGCELLVDTDTGLGPPGCVFGTSATPTPAEFANQCTTATAIPFNNCARLNACDTAALTAALQVSVPPPPPQQQPPPPSQTIPTVNCVDVAPNPIYVTGSTNLPPLISAVQPLLYQGTPAYTVVFAPQTSCKGADSVYSPDPTKHVIKNIANNYAFFYDASGKQTFCLLDASGNTVDVGESDVFPSSCSLSYTTTPGISDDLGPIQAIDFVVPSASAQVAISAEAAHAVFAAGGNGGRGAPWTDDQYYFTRGAGTGTTILPSVAIQLEPTKWWGIDRLSATNLVASMVAVDPTAAERTIGVLSSDFADKNRGNLRTLAFQQAGQKFGYLPDSTKDSFDKANVRDGHYPIWGAIHLIATDVSGGAPSPAASALISQLVAPMLKEQVLTAIVSAGFVPACAMTVTHTTEVGPLAAYKPSFGCSCFFEKQVNGGVAPARCKSCRGAGDCGGATPACNYGFCEAPGP